MAINRRVFLCTGVATGVLLNSNPGALFAAEEQPPSFTDPLYTRPYIDVDEWREVPVRHRYIHGGFAGTDLRFVMQFPPAEKYEGRFFQHLTAVVVSEMQAGNIFNNDFVGFAVGSGGAAVVSNQGGLAMSLRPDLGGDYSIGGYRASAAVAMYARTLANEMYGLHRCYGYAFGGSGGGYRSISGAENTKAWDGVVPYIHGNLQMWPSSYAARARGQRILGDKIPAIADALEPGGNGDPYSGLSALERSVLEEASRIGFPQRTWVFAEAMGVGPLSVIFQNIQLLDPTYFTDFWSTPGYLGHDSPGEFEGVRVEHHTQVKRVIMSNEAAAVGLPPPTTRGDADPDTAWRSFEADHGAPLPIALELASVPSPGSFLTLANISLVTGAAAGKQLDLGGLQGNFARIQFSPNAGSLRNVTELIRPGDEVKIDNSNILAYETMYRHTLLTPDYYVGNQFRDSEGTPIYPQRPRSIHHELMAGAIPTIPTGRFFGKMIIVQSLLDWDAHPWCADWYRAKVHEYFGSRFKEHYRLYYIDHATHGSIPDPSRTVPFSGALQRALQDLSAWVEYGIEPPDETSYDVLEGQVKVPAGAAQRKGIQAVGTLLVNGQEVVHVQVGEPVMFTATIETPPGGGKVVSAEWDFHATSRPVPGEDGRFAIKESFEPSENVTITRRFSFDRPGTYFPALRFHSQRQGDAQTPYARVANLARMRVVVT